MTPVEQFGFSEIFFYKITLDTHQVYIIGNGRLRKVREYQRRLYTREGYIQGGGLEPITQPKVEGGLLEERSGIL